MDYNLLFLFLLVIVLYLTMICLNFVCISKKNTCNPDTNNGKSYDVFCLMVTGYTPQRVSYAKKSVTNFLEQNYEHKHLIILNQSSENILDSPNSNRMVEIKVAVDKLGILRNKSVDMVPKNAVWTTWDDDDYRHPEYLTTFMHEFRDQNVDFVMFQNRLEYNILTQYKFKIKLKSGTMIFFSRDNSLKYDPVESMEDQGLKRTALRKLRCKVINNDPKLYIRLIHDSNTSLYVNKDKDALRDTSKHIEYFEFLPNPDEIEYMNKIISSYY